MFTFSTYGGMKFQICIHTIMKSSEHTEKLKIELSQHNNKEKYSQKWPLFDRLTFQPNFYDLVIMEPVRTPMTRPRMHSHQMLWLILFFSLRPQQPSKPRITTQVLQRRPERGITNDHQRIRLPIGIFQGDLDRSYSTKDRIQIL